MRNQRGVVGRLACTAILVGLAATPADARHRLGAHVEGGFGQSNVRPLQEESSVGATASAGVSKSLVGTLRVGLEVSATASVGGIRPPGCCPTPESSLPGDRSLTTVLLGVEAMGPHPTSGAFAFIGAGAGHATLKNALGHVSQCSQCMVLLPPPYVIIPSRSLTAFALGAGAGYRFGGEPGPFGFQLALRSHALVDAGRVPASAYAFTIGLAY